MDMLGMHPQMLRRRALGARLAATILMTMAREAMLTIHRPCRRCHYGRCGKVTWLLYGQCGVVTWVCHLGVQMHLLMLRNLKMPRRPTDRVMSNRAALRRELPPRRREPVR